MITKMYNIKGMHCSGCVDTVKNALRQTPGVIEAQVQLTEPNAIVSLEDNMPVEELQQAVAAAGSYQLAEISDETAGQPAAAASGKGWLSGLFGKKDCCK